VPEFPEKWGHLKTWSSVAGASWPRAEFVLARLSYALEDPDVAPTLN
jgi:hypothetical protein